MINIEINYSVINNPEFDKTTRVNDWRNYVPKNLIDGWDEVSIRERGIIFMMADDFASREEWD